MIAGAIFCCSGIAFSQEGELRGSSTGNAVFEPNNCKHGLTKSKQGDVYLLRLPDGRATNKDGYTYVARFKCGRPTIVCVAKRRCGFIRSDGTLIAGRYFWSVQRFNDGGAGVFPEKGKFGIIDRSGRFVLEPVQYKVPIFSTGANRSGYKSNDGPVLIDRRVAEALADDPSPLLEELNRTCSDGITIVKKGRSFVYNTKDGKPYIKGEFDFATCFRLFHAWVAVPDRKKWCQITTSGDIVPNSCRCGEPFIVNEWFSILSPPKGMSCYEYGLQRILDLDRRAMIK